MLKLICDHCGLEIELIHTLIHKREDTDGGDGQGYRFYWEISSEQDGIGSRYKGENYFDRSPNELDKWNWDNGMGTWDKDSVRGHFCKQCKEAYKKHLEGYKDHKISLEGLLKDEDLSSVNTFTAKAKELKDKLDQDYQDYKKEFIK